MKKNIILSVFYLWTAVCFSQQLNDSIQSNKGSHVYLDLLGGVVVGNPNGFGFGLTGNFQNKKDLFSLRLLYVLDSDELISDILNFNNGESINELAILYGKCFLHKKSIISISMGASTNIWKYQVMTNNALLNKRKQYIALPFEAKIITFKNTKEKFGMLFGAKLFGSFGKATFLGLGFNLSFGKHKRQ